jgi:hypothetical protein
MTPVSPNPWACDLQTDRGQSRCPQGLRPEVALIIEALARAAVRREDRYSVESVGAGVK